MQKLKMKRKWKIKGKICYNKNIHLYHLSEENHNNRIFKPRIPKSAADGCGENTTIARICFSSSMSGAYRAITDIKDHGDWCYFPLYVHVPENIVDVVKNKNVIVPHKDLVFDQEYTNEHWVREKVKLKCIGKALFKLGRYNYAGPFRTPVKIKWIEKYE